MKILPSIALRQSDRHAAPERTCGSILALSGQGDCKVALRGERTNTGDIGEVNSCDAVQLTAQIECRIIRLLSSLCPVWQQHLLSAPGHRPRRPSRLSTSEIMTLVIAFHDSDYRTFKHFYRKEVCRHRRVEFPDLVSYQRLIECLPSVVL